MAWVDDGDGGLVGGGTEFPVLRRKVDRRWCRFVECDAEGAAANGSSGESGISEAPPAVDGDVGATGVVFRPLVGNAIYWENFHSDGSGRGYDESWHAGLPVVEGVKVGLNIWSWGRIE